jgi:hypothetical protein
MFKLQIANDRRSPRLIPNQCHLSDPPHFSLPSTFKFFDADPDPGWDVKIQIRDPA